MFMRKLAPVIREQGIHHDRWWVIPRNYFANIFLHHFLTSDDDYVLHNHPWMNCTIVLRGRYNDVRFEHPPVPGQPLPPIRRVPLRTGSILCRLPSTAHRVELVSESCWTLFITGPVWGTWGYWCPGGRWIRGNTYQTRLKFAWKRRILALVGRRVDFIDPFPVTFYTPSDAGTDIRLRRLIERASVDGQPEKTKGGLL